MSHRVCQVIITAGVGTSAVLSLTGAEALALVFALAANLLWIWER